MGVHCWTVVSGLNCWRVDALQSGAATRLSRSEQSDTTGSRSESGRGHCRCGAAVRSTTPAVHSELSHCTVCTADCAVTELTMAHHGPRGRLQTAAPPLVMLKQSNTSFALHAALPFFNENGRCHFREYRE